MNGPQEKNVFQKIIDREIPADIVYEDDLVIAFIDIAPVAPVHVLIVPKSHIASPADVETEDQEILGHMMSTVRPVAEKLGVLEKGFRLVLNSGRDGGQEIPHLHMHLIGGRFLKWPPG